MEQYTPDFAEALNDCADRLASGQTINDCLRAHPDHAEQLRPLLQVAQLPRRARANPAEVNAARTQVSAVLDTLLEDFTIQRQPRRVTPRLLQIAAVLLFALGIVVLFSVFRGDSLPSVNEIPLSQTAVPVVENTETPTETASPTGTATGTLPPTSTPTLTLTTTQTATPTMTVTPMPTATVTASATSTPSQTPSEPTTAPTNAPAVQAPPPTAAPNSAPDSGVPTDPTACVPRIPEGWEDYTVKAGDTLSAVALASGTSVEALIAANCLPASGLLITGQRIYVPQELDDDDLGQEGEDDPQSEDDSDAEQPLEEDEDTSEDEDDAEQPEDDSSDDNSDSGSGSDDDEDD